MFEDEKNENALVFILPNLIISVLLNIPKFSEPELVYVNVTDTSNLTRLISHFAFVNCIPSIVFI